MVSRREILKTIGLIGLAAVISPVEKLRAQGVPVSFPDRWNGEPLARVCQPYQPARIEATTDSEVASELAQNDVVRVRRVVRGQQVYSNSDLWLETAYGYIYASLVQPMRFHLPTTPVADLGAGRWAEMIVPHSRATRRAGSNDPEDDKGEVTYGGVFRVDQLATGADGKSYYRVREQYQTLYVPATHLRLIDDADLSPIAPDVAPEDKYLDVNLTDQTIVAYQEGEAVWASYASTGVVDHETPTGTHVVWDKRISERMVADTVSDDPDFYNLPGVPFVCYFTDNWVATHGTYWHNDYGRPRSHGCVNVTPQAARWLWRWTTPPGSLDELYIRSTNGYTATRVYVHH